MCTVTLVLVISIIINCAFSLNGRYTRNIDNYKLAVPHKANLEGGFHTFKIPSYFVQNSHSDQRRKRSLSDPDLVNYVIYMDSKKYHAELWPNHNLIAPNAISEHYEPSESVQNRRLTRMPVERMCHYTGRIRGEPVSKLALSTCDGLAGYMLVDGQRFFIEPVDGHQANAHGHHLHVIYQKQPGDSGEHRQQQSCGTSISWEDQWKKRFHDQYSKGANMEKRSFESVHRYLETLIVCDKKFIEHHKNIDTETYVLTIMNMVSDFYHDATSGNQMDVVVVRIMYLDKEEEEIDLVISQDADNTLASFCKWQQKINPKDIASPNHHDIAVLLTRYDICTDNMATCGLMGLAYVASACTSDEPCAINEDSGLVLGIVVAHEMGHVMGCAHDKEGESACPAQDEDESYFVMAPYVHLYTTKWSTCSRGFMTALFENGLGDCLNDEPQVTLYKDRNILPGVVYDADEQCRMMIPNSKVCSWSQESFCSVLMCESKPGKCSTKHEPPADGTKCGENKWCYRKKCIQIGERPEAINGGWSKWTDFSSCSVTCGGGVQLATRECNNPIPQHGGRYCLGDRKQVKVCNLDACPKGSLSFREVQCREHNEKPFQGKLHQWKEYMKKEEPCVLYCINEKSIFAKLEPAAKDGTKCKRGTYNMCVGGTCKVGCDGQIDSDAVEDICGICNGDGSQCKIIEETYQGTIGRGYTKVAMIPVGSRNVLIEELGPSVNTIAISDLSEQKFYLNGDKREQRDGDKDFGETKGIYTHPVPRKENLVIHGPLTEDLIFHVVFYVGENVGYRYRYAEPSLDTSNYLPSYHWEQTEFEECSVRCGGGFHSTKYTCIEEKAGKVSNEFCDAAEKPEKITRPCNEQPCKTKWKVGQWSACHACRYKSGVRQREVECVKENPHAGTDDILVEDNECKDEKKPPIRELCNSHKKCKDRRKTDDIPDVLLEDVWKQIFHHPDKKGKKRPSDTDKSASSGHKRQSDKKPCDGATESSAATVVNTGTSMHPPISAEEEKEAKVPKLEVGKIVKDRIPAEEIQVIEVPLKQTHLNLDLSDTAFETMGDQVDDSLDTGKAQILTGDAAAKVMAAWEHGGEEVGLESSHTTSAKQGKQASTQTTTTTTDICLL